MAGGSTYGNPISVTHLIISGSGANSGVTKVYLPNKYRGFLVLASYSNDVKGLYVLGASSGGSTSIKAVLSASPITISTAANLLTFTNTNGNGAEALFFNLLDQTTEEPHITT